MTSAASAPPEILERIFRYAAFGVLDIPSKSWLLRHYLTSNSAENAIGQVPLVNRCWNVPATRILYWELDVNEQQQEDRSTIMSRNALLTRTLEESPHLQPYVRSLCLNAWMIDTKDLEGLEGWGLLILRCCPLVQHLWINGWIPTLLDDVHTTIATFTRLRFLSIHSSPGYREPFCSFERLEAMMKGWPNLEHLSVGSDVVTGHNGDSLQSTRNPPVKSHITRLTLSGLSSLQGFTHITPNLVELSLWTHSQPPDFFLLHAPRWKRTLRCLKFLLGLSDTNTQWRAIMMVISGFENLQQLRIRNIFPLTLLELPDTLQKVKFTVRYRDIPILFDVLDQKLPRSIKIITLGVEYSYLLHQHKDHTENAQPNLERELRAFCEQRQWKWLAYNPHKYRIYTSGATPEVLVTSRSAEA